MDSGSGIQPQPYLKNLKKKPHRSRGVRPHRAPRLRWVSLPDSRLLAQEFHGLGGLHQPEELPSVSSLV